MKLTTSSILALVLFTAGSNQDLLLNIRTAYPYCSDRLVICEGYLEQLEKAPQSAVYQGYRAALTMIMANHVSNPITKLEYFKRGKANLESVIAQHPFEIELRYLRYSIQRECPSFLRYNNALENDLKFLQAEVTTLTDATLQAMIVEIIKK